MTLVAGVHSDRFAVLTADSRLTSMWSSGKSTRVDCCQKVFRVGDRLIAGFCGDLVAMAETISGLSMIYQMNANFLVMDNIHERLPTILREYAKVIAEKLGRSPDLGLIVGGVSSSGKYGMVVCMSPSFDLCRVQLHEYALIGSGTPIIEPVAESYGKYIEEINQFAGGQAPDLTAANIAQFVDMHLKDFGITTVGRAMHSLCIDDKGVWRIPHGISRNRFEFEEGEIAEIKTDSFLRTENDEDGNWIQYASDGTRIKLLTPMEIVANFQLLAEDSNFHAQR